MPLHFFARCQVYHAPASIVLSTELAPKVCCAFCFASREPKSNQTPAHNRCAAATNLTTPTLSSTLLPRTTCIKQYRNAHPCFRRPLTDGFFRDFGRVRRPRLYPAKNP